MNPPTTPINTFLVRKVAADHQICEATLRRALSGAAIRGAAVAARAREAVQAYKILAASSARKNQ